MKIRNHCVTGVLWLIAAAALVTAEAQSGKRDGGAELKALVKEFDRWTDPSMSDLSGEDRANQSLALQRWSAIIPELQKLFQSGAKITVEAPRSISWPRGESVKGATERLSPREFAQRVGRMAFTIGPRQIAVSDPGYTLNKDRATVRMKPIPAQS